MRASLLVAEDERVGAGAVKQRQRHARVRGVMQRTLALDHDDVGVPGRLEHHLLNGARDEIGGHRVHGDPGVGDEDACLPRGDKCRAHAALFQLGAQLQRGGHLAHVAVAAHGERDQRVHAGGAPRGDGPHRGWPANVEDPAALGRRKLRELGIVGDEHVQAGDHVPAAQQRLGDHHTPRCGQRSPRRGDADQQAIGLERRRRLEVGDDRNVTADADAFLSRAAGTRRVHDRDDFLRPVSQDPHGALRIRGAEASLGQNGQASLLPEHRDLSRSLEVGNPVAASARPVRAEVSATTRTLAYSDPPSRPP